MQVNEINALYYKWNLNFLALGVLLVPILTLSEKVRERLRVKMRVKKEGFCYFWPYRIINYFDIARGFGVLGRT